MTQMIANAEKPLPELAKLSLVETQFIAEYLNNGHNGLQAYLTIKPHVRPSTARVASSEIMQKAHIRAYVEAYKRSTIIKGELTKAQLLDHTKWGIETARSKEELSALFKGIECGARLINAYDIEADDVNKYIGLLGKITANNVQINIGCKDDSK
jgi:hypothetical protein